MCVFYRFLEKEGRQVELKKELSALDVPPGVYVPLCSSSDPWLSILKIVPQECYAFSTKARCPALIFVESQKHREGVDVASFLAQQCAQSLDTDAATGWTIWKIGAGLHRLTEAYGLLPHDHISGSKTDAAERLGGFVEAISTSNSGPAQKQIFGELYSQKVKRIQEASSLGQLDGWTVQGLLAKSNDDLRQEVINAMLFCVFVHTIIVF